MRYVAMLLGLCLVPATVGAGIITVDCEGGGDYTTIPTAVWYASASDTVLVMPCTYPVTSSSWPIALDADSPAIVGSGGAAATVLEGDGTRSAFRINEGEHYARVEIRGLTLRNVNEVLERDGLDTSAHIEFTDNVVENCADGLDAYLSGGLIARNIMRDNGGTGIRTYHFSGTIEDNEIYGNTRGINGACCEEPVIRRNHIHDNEEYGIRATFSYTVEDNLVERNGYAGLVVAVSGTFVRNTIRHNGVGVDHWGCSGTFSENDIYDNDLCNARLWDFSSCVVDMTMNWWGTADSTAIAESIWDCHDDPSVHACADFVPFCVSPGCEATPVEPSSWGSIKAMYRQAR